MYHYVRGKGWLPGTPIKVYAQNDKIAIIRVIDVPEGVSRSASDADIHEDSRVYLPRHENTELDYAIGPYADGRLAPSEWLCAISIKDLP